MPYCPTCGAEYPLGQTKCPECDTELVEFQTPPSEEKVEFEGEPVLLCKTSDMTGAEFLAQTFEEEHMPFIMNPGPVEFRMMPLEYGQKSIRIFVPESALEQAKEAARRILADFQEGNEENAEEN
jgi:hypothetical protein